MVLERGKSRYGDDEFLVLCIIEGRGRSEVEEPQYGGLNQHYRQNSYFTSPLSIFHSTT